MGVLSCILERAPQLVHGAAKIGGASSGCLVAAAVTVGTPMGESLVCSTDVASTPITLFSVLKSHTISFIFLSAYSTVLLITNQNSHLNKQQTRFSVGSLTCRVDKIVRANST